MPTPIVFASALLTLLSSCAKESTPPEHERQTATAAVESSATQRAEVLARADVLASEVAATNRPSESPSEARAELAVAATEKGPVVAAADTESKAERPDEAAVRKELAAVRGAVRSCARRNNLSSGSLDVKVTIDPAGVVQEAEVVGAALPDEAAKCVRDAVRAVRVPASEKGLILTYTYELARRP